MDATTVSDEISSTGRTMGRSEGTRPGRGRVAAAGAAAAGGTTGIRRSTQPANSNPTPAAGNATAGPTRTVGPRPPPGAPATASGPGVGGTSVCVPPAPAAIARRYLR